MTDILERAKAVDPEMLAVLNWGALRDLISELIAEVEAKQANNEYLQKMTEEAQGIMQESQLLLCKLLLCKEANEAEQLQNEVERLRSIEAQQLIALESTASIVEHQAARIKELEEANRNIDKRRDEMAAFIERLKAAFLKSETERKFYTTINGMNSEFDWNGYPECPQNGIHKEWFRQQAREALERIKNGND